MGSIWGSLPEDEGRLAILDNTVGNFGGPGAVVASNNVTLSDL